MTNYLNIFIFTFAFSVGTSFADIDTENKGEQAMIRSLRSAIDANTELKTKDIVLGVGSTGCKAFSKPASSGALNVFMTWQWLDCMRDLTPGTVVVTPKHALSDQFKSIISKVHLIPISGVVHTKSIASIEHANTDAINKKVGLIVMLAGDTEQPRGAIMHYTPRMAVELVETTPTDRRTLFLNSPRTGKHEELNGRLVIDKTAHRTKTDAVTQRVINECEAKNCEVVDFKFGENSLWDPALKFVRDNKIPLVLPGESTSMISEALGVGVRPALYVHNAMTPTSRKYVEELVSQNKATLYPAIPVSASTTQEAVPSQEMLIVGELSQIISKDRLFSEHKRMFIKYDSEIL